MNQKYSSNPAPPVGGTAVPPVKFWPTAKSVSPNFVSGCELLKTRRLKVCSHRSSIPSIAILSQIKHRIASLSSFGFLRNCFCNQNTSWAACPCERSRHVEEALVPHLRNHSVPTTEAFGSKQKRSEAIYFFRLRLPPWLEWFLNAIRSMARRKVSDFWLPTPPHYSQLHFITPNYA